MDDLREKMDALAVDGAHRRGAARGGPRRAMWITPKLVAEIAYAEVTPDKVLRHSSFLGLRGTSRRTRWCPKPPLTAAGPAPDDPRQG